jgi:hypothetical protein
MIKLIWLPIVFKCAPLMLGTSTLDDRVNRMPGRSVGVPRDVLREVAAHAYDVVTKVAQSSKPTASIFERVVAYDDHLQYCANAITEIVGGTIDSVTADVRYPEISRILDKYLV